MDGNGYLREFERFAPRKLSVDDLIERARGFHAAPEPDAAVVVASLSSCDLVRYRLCSFALEMAWSEVSPSEGNLHRDADASGLLARFGLVDRETGRCKAVILAAAGQFNRPAGILEIEAAEGVDNGVLLEGLAELGLPPAKSNGCDHVAAEKWDLWHDGETWSVRDPEFAVAVRIERVCFGVRPVVRESVDVVLPLDPRHPLDGSEDAADLAREHYWGVALDEVMVTHPEVKPGFSSWMVAEVRTVKVVDRAIMGHVKEPGVGHPCP